MHRGFAVHLSSDWRRKTNPNNNKIPHDFPIATMDEVCEDEKKKSTGYLIFYGNGLT